MFNLLHVNFSQHTRLSDGLPLRFAAGISTAVAAVCIAQPTEVLFSLEESVPLTLGYACYVWSAT